MSSVLFLALCLVGQTSPPHLHRRLVQAGLELVRFQETTLFQETVPNEIRLRLRPLRLLGDGPMILCRRGHQNDDGAVFCSVCHDYLGWESRQEDPPVRPAVSATVDPSHLSIVPGAQTNAQVELRNRANLADEFHLSVVGAASDWVRVEPDVVSLLPEKTGLTTLIIQPPKSPSTPSAG